MRSIPVFVAFLAAAVISGIGCTKKTDNTVTTRNYLAVGDSYTAGELVAPGERFSAQTTALLKIDNITIDPLVYIAKTGWRTDQILASLNASTLDPKYDIITLLAGVNDEYQKVDTSTYRANFTALVEKSISLSGNNPSHVYVISMPDYSASFIVSQSDKAAVSADIDRFNDINKEIAAAYGCEYLDIVPTTRLALNDRSMFAADGLHPSGKQYAEWAKLLAPMINAGIK
jgi:lysophospholipase L1-like esterase